MEVYSGWGNSLEYDPDYDPPDYVDDYSSTDAASSDATVHKALDTYGLSVGFVAGTDLLCEYESSPQNHRVSCARCGSQLYSHADTHPIVRVRVGALDEDPGSGVAAHFMMGSKAGWFEVADGVEQFSELAPISYFLPDATLTRRAAIAPQRPNAALVARVYEAFRERDLPTAFGLLAPDVEIHQASEIPWGGDYVGHEGAAAFFGKLVQTITSAVTVERFVDAGEHVVAIGRTRGTVNATGQSFDVPIAHVWTVRDGLVRRRCTEGRHCCGVPVWRSFPDVERRR